MAPKRAETTKRPATKAPTKAAPTKAAPMKAAPTKAAPTKAAPTKAAPTKAAPTKAAPTKAAPTKAAPTKAKGPKAKAATPPGKGAGAAKAKAAAKEPAGRAPLGEGDVVPAFTLADQSGAPVTSDSLRGRAYVLYFYPKDDTPGCTREACGFRDDLGKFEALGVRVIGASPDKSETHARFAKKYALTFPLLADVEKKLANAFGVWVKKQNYGREYMGIERSTFLVGADGKIRKAWRGVKVDGHVEAVRAAATPGG
jgi:peroxiredoxin Q/BCP